MLNDILQTDNETADRYQPLMRLYRYSFLEFESCNCKVSEKLRQFHENALRQRNPLWNAICGFNRANIDIAI